MSTRNNNPLHSDFLKRQLAKMSDEDYSAWQQEFEKIRRNKPGNALEEEYIPPSKEELDRIIGRL